METQHQECRMQDKAENWLFVRQSRKTHDGGGSRLVFKQSQESPWSVEEPKGERRRDDPPAH